MALAENEICLTYQLKIALLPLCCFTSGAVPTPCAFGSCMWI